jgi:hypothetical protein
VLFVISLMTAFIQMPAHTQHVKCEARSLQTRYA